MVRALDRHPTDQLIRALGKLGTPAQIPALEAHAAAQPLDARRVDRAIKEIRLRR